MLALNFYSPLFAEQLRSRRKTATIRLGDKSAKYRSGEVVWVVVGHRYGAREKIFTAVIDAVEVKAAGTLSPRDIERDNPEYRRLEETLGFLGQLYGRELSHTELVTVVHFSPVLESGGLG